jgi:hypothetical protein
VSWRIWAWLGALFAGAGIAVYAILSDQNDNVLLIALAPLIALAIASD